ncbi:hypothetical protein CSOJ01_12796 [Colletotrichum sojae]|uniref:Uncharacterized protein n=1 Tax=Colletotrichum sojae TaxID=2175907 RepID=A0A8H6MLX4_9PEZI|nr:hypothetical protein CSOJ01_12796 [Colletotrichum sojae]
MSHYQLRKPCSSTSKRLRTPSARSPPSSLPAGETVVVRPAHEAITHAEKSLALRGGGSPARALSHGVHPAFAIRGWPAVALRDDAVNRSSRDLHDSSTAATQLRSASDFEHALLMFRTEEPEDGAERVEHVAHGGDQNLYCPRRNRDRCALTSSTLCDGQGTMRVIRTVRPNES